MQENHIAAKVWQEIVLYLLKIYSAIMVSLTSYIRNHVASLTWLKQETYGNIDEANEIINRFYKGPQNETDGIFNASCIYLLNGHIQEARRYFIKFINNSTNADLKNKAVEAIGVIDSICHFYKNEIFGKFNPIAVQDYNEHRAVMDILQCIWEQHQINERKEYAFTTDGVLFRSDDVDEYDLWFNPSNSKRILFLLKDQHQDGDGQLWDEDIREWRRYEHVENLETKFIQRIAKYLWGLTNIKKDSQYEQWWYSETDLPHVFPQVKELFRTAPIAFVECKKYPGGGKIRDKILKRYLAQDKEFLKEEISILKPNYIVCCGQPIYHCVTHDIFNFEELTFYRNGICLHEKTSTLIFCATHPSALQKPEVIYESVMYNYRYFISNHDKFKNY